MKANIARQIAGARDRSKLWGRLGARVRWGNRRNSTTTPHQGPVVEEPGTAGNLDAVNAGTHGKSAGAVQPARGGLVFRARQQELESTREAVAKLEAQFPHLQVRITETEEETTC